MDDDKNTHKHTHRHSSFYWLRTTAAAADCVPYVNLLTCVICVPLWFCFSSSFSHRFPMTHIWIYGKFHYSIHLYYSFYDMNMKAVQSIGIYRRGICLYWQIWAYAKKCVKTTENINSIAASCLRAIARNFNQIISLTSYVSQANKVAAYRLSTLENI